MSNIKNRSAKASKSGLYEWTSDLSLSVEGIDEQHRKWFDLTNSLLLKVQSGEVDNEAVQAYLADVVQYAFKHFKEEEAYMRKLRIPDDVFQWHILSHNAFVTRVNALAEQCKKGSPKAVEELVSFMTGWLTKHIREYDVTYVKFYEKHS